jgi:hypothetical protein
MVWVKFKKSNFIAYSKIKNKIVIKRTWNKYEEKKIELNGLKFKKVFALNLRKRERKRKKKRLAEPNYRYFWHTRRYILQRTLSSSKRHTGRQYLVVKKPRMHHSNGTGTVHMLARVLHEIKVLFLNII